MKVSIQDNTQKSVLDYLREKNVPISAPCGGHGTCGKCKVKVHTQQPLPMEEKEKQLLGEEAIQAGYRLACKLPCQEALEVEVLDEEALFYVVSDYEEESARPQVEVMIRQGAGYGIAIDIGTTTLAFELIALEARETKKVHTSLNSGRRYGADVISRIDYASQNGTEDLQKVMQEDLIKGITWLCKAQGITFQEIAQVVIAGNTTMLHILVGASCKGLGIYPFEAVFLDKQECNLGTLLGCTDFKGEVTLLPGISTYVGADLVSGLIKCEMQAHDEVSLLIDIGTNGEMIIGNQKRLLGVATAAGPAFEGGNMSCGTGSIAGAICSATYEAGGFQVQTIGNAPVVGICGSGLIDLVAESLKQGLIDETGFIEASEPICVTPNKQIVLTQQDIRHFQLAKSAIRSGIEILMKNYGVSAADITKVYLAGGFGKFINLENAFEIGLMPREFENKVQRVGNAALGGAKKYLLDRSISEEQIKTIKNISTDLNLANDPTFNDYFITYMLFEEV
ncbi:MAG: ASKHA domain-containing protein [Cellulosilyticaceae bacterium]